MTEAIDKSTGESYYRLHNHAEGLPDMADKLCSYAAILGLVYWFEFLMML